jgi:hypothetical protein
MHIAKSRLMSKFGRHFERHIQATGATCRKEMYIPNIMADGALIRSGYTTKGISEGSCKPSKSC